MQRIASCSVLALCLASSVARAEKVCYAFEGFVHRIEFGRTPGPYPIDSNSELSSGLRKVQVGDRFSGTYSYNDEAPGFYPYSPDTSVHETPLSAGGFITLDIANKARGRVLSNGSVGTHITSALSRHTGVAGPFDFEPADGVSPWYQWGISLSFGLGDARPGALVKRPSLISRTGSLALLPDVEMGELPPPWILGTIDKLRPCIELFDPVPLDASSDLLSGNRIATSTAVLTSQGSRRVEGIAADGVSQLVARVPGVETGRTYQIDVLDENNMPGDPASVGGIGSIGGPREGATALPAVTATFKNAIPISTSTGPELLFVYRAPLDFPTSRADYIDNPERTVTIRIQSMQGNTLTPFTERTVRVIRPLTAFIHGIWSSPAAAWDDSGLYPVPPADLPLSVTFLRYNIPVTATSVVPAYTKYGTTDVPRRLQASSFAFTYIARQHIREQLETRLDNFRRGRNRLGIPVAATQADVVAHSMGGLVTRALGLFSESFSPRNFAAGSVHKLITISTPHRGSPIAVHLHDPANTCARDLGTTEGTFIVQSATVNGVPGIAGGSWSLRGDPRTAFVSDELTQLKAPRIGPPTAYIYGQMSPAQLQGLDSFTVKRWGTQFRCSGEPFADGLTSAAYPNLIGGDSDALVPVTSSRNGQFVAYPLTAVHSRSMVSAGFGGPYVTQAASGVVSQVLRLLAIPISTSAVFQDPR